MKYSFIVPTINRFNELKIFLDSVSIQEFLNEIEVIVVDQNDQDILNIKKLTDNYSFVKYIHSYKKGLSFNRNIGIKKAIGNWIIISDDDCILAKDYVSVLNNSCNNVLNNQIEIFYGNVLNIEDSEPYNFRLTTSDNKLNYNNFDKVCSIGFIIKKDVFNRVGYFDERFGVGAVFGACEESDMILRAIYNRVQSLYIPQLKVYHPKMLINKYNNIKKGISYSYGFGAFYRKCITIYRGSLRYIMFFKFIKNLFITFCGLLLNVFDFEKRKYYWVVFKVKMTGFGAFKK